VPPADLAAALDALLGNVFSHTPDGTAMGVEVTIAAGAAVLTVHDAGPGFETPPRTDAGMVTDGSTGLGLDIARRTVQAAGGSMRLGASASGGALVELVFPIAH
jgi:signal transduction histidine kinase